jgi:hypothetical protein
MRSSSVYLTTSVVSCLCLFVCVFLILRDEGELWGHLLPVCLSLRVCVIIVSKECGQLVLPRNSCFFLPFLYPSLSAFIAHSLSLHID